MAGSNAACKNCVDGLVMDRLTTNAPSMFHKENNLLVRRKRIQRVYYTMGAIFQYTFVSSFPLPHSPFLVA